jgi:hypothetical protein
MKSRNILPPKRFWTTEEEAHLRQHYPTALTADLAKHYGCDSKRVLAKANALGLHKTISLIAETARQRNRERAATGLGNAGMFKPGLQPWNKGVPGATGTQAGCRATQFKPGTKPHTWVPVGSLRICDGQLQRKANDDPGPNHIRWKPVTRLVWEEANGPVPAGHVVAFKPGRQTTDLALITLDALQLQTRVQMMHRNSLHTQYPPEVRRLVQLRGVLSRQINRKTRQAKEAEPA